MGHDDPLDGQRVDPRLADGLDLIGPLTPEACIDEGEVFGGRIAYDIDVGVRDEIILPWDESNPWCDISHISLLTRIIFPLFR
jgi:hypothetical protein